MSEPTGRICFVTNDFAGVIRNGGVGTHFLLMSRMLAQRGWEVSVLFCGPVDDEHAVATTTALLANEGISFTWLDGAPAPAWYGIPQFGDGVSTLVASQLAFEALEALQAEHRFDVIEFSDWGALGFRTVQAKRSGLAFADVRLAVKLHSPTEFQRRGNLSNRQSPSELKLEYCERYAFEHADLQLSPSHYMLADTRDQGWNVRQDAVVAYPFPHPQRNPPSQVADVRELVFFGRLERRKGLDLFLAVLDALPVDLPVLFLGRDADIDGRKATDVIAERMADRLYRIETGLDRDAAIAELAQGDRLAVMPSRSETFGFAVAECIANEIPFLAADAGGVPEVVAHEGARARWLFEPTVKGLAAALERRLSSPADAERELRSAVAAACDPDDWNDRVEETYRGLLTRPSSRARAHPHATATVAVAVTHYNHPNYLPAALASLAAQTRAPDEVFVIDDGSSEEAALRVFAEQEAQYPEWTFLRQQNAGPGAARNVCLARTKSALFLPFDSDNVAAPALVETLVTAALADGRDVATCHLLAFTEDEDIPAGRFGYRYGPTGGPRVLTVVEDVFGDTCGLFRAEALRAVGGFETERWSPHEDWETYTKLAFAGFRVDVVPRVLFYYRTEVGGRLERLTADPHQAHRLRRRMICDLLADAELSREERIALWECLLGFVGPTDELQVLVRAHEELAEWAHQSLADVHAWRDSQLEAVRGHSTAQLEAVRESLTAQLEAVRESITAEVGEATSRAEWAEAELADLNAWRDRELEGLREWLTAKVGEATSRAERAEAELADLRSEINGSAAARGTIREGLRDVLEGRRHRGRS